MRPSFPYVVLLVLAACDGGIGATADGGAGGGVDGGGGGDGGGPCVGLECRQVDCPGGGTTSVSGVVATPRGDLPLYNVVVYVPNGTVGPIVEGASCERCDAQLSGNPLVQTQTDTMGHFKLDDMPTGTDIPLVIQIGKWRRQIVLPAIDPCVDQALETVSTRLPGKQSATDNLPRIALSTGGADALECLLLKVGIDQSEFTPEGGSGRVNLYHGQGGSSQYAAAWNGGASLSDSPEMWNSLANLQKYDIVLLSCEGDQNLGQKTVAARQNMQDYTTGGGRVFASHWHNAWVEQGPAPFPTLADFDFQADLADPFTAQIDTSFEKGMALAEWLVNVGGSATLGEIVIHAGQHTINAVNVGAQQWITGMNPTSVQYMTFNTPVGVAPEDQCGRMVLSDIHVSSGDTPGSNYPNGCTTTDLTPQEKALIFMLFDLSACIEPDVID